MFDRFVARLWSFSSGADQEPAIAARSVYYRYALVFGGLAVSLGVIARLALAASPRTQPGAHLTLQLVAGLAVVVCFLGALVCLVLDAFARRSVRRMILYGMIACLFVFTAAYVTWTVINR